MDATNYYFDFELKVTDDRFEGQAIKFNLNVFFEKYHSVGRSIEPVLSKNLIATITECVVKKAILSPDAPQAFEHIVSKQMLPLKFQIESIANCQYIGQISLKINGR